MEPKQTVTDEPVETIVKSVQKADNKWNFAVKYRDLKIHSGHRRRPS